MILNNTQVVNDNNGNGKLDPGEMAGIVTYISNAGNQTATNVQGKLRVSTPYVTITDSTYGYGNLVAGASANNISDPYDVQVSSSTPAGTVAPFQLILTSAESTWTHLFSLVIGRPPGQIIWGPKILPVFPSTGFIYGLTYDRIGNRIFVLDAYGRYIYFHSSDSFVTYQGTIAAPDTNCDDIAYSPSDDRLWVTSFYQKRIWKINKSGTILRSFNNPAVDYPVGLAWNGQRLWCADRRTTLGASQLIYVSDTMGVATEYTSPIQGYYNSRCLDWDSYADKFLFAQTWFNSGGTAVDSTGVIELNGTTPPSVTGNKFLCPAGWNIRGVAYDYRDGNLWITIPQGGASVNQIVKVQGFRTPSVSVEEHRAAAPAKNVTIFVKPNPASRLINYVCQVPVGSKAGLKIFDATGALIYTIVEPAIQATGKITGVWLLDHSIPDGVYFLILESDEGQSAVKIIIAR